MLLFLYHFGPDDWTSLTSSEDLGARLRRECESVVREALRDGAMSETGRRNMIAECIFERGKSGR